MLNQYTEYIRVAREYLEHCFMSDEEKVVKHQKQTAENDAISGEIERIQRTMMMLNDENQTFQEKQVPSSVP